MFQIVKRHFERYTPEMVERITGCPNGCARPYTPDIGLVDGAAQASPERDRAERELLDAVLDQPFVLTAITAAMEEAGGNATAENAARRAQRVA